MIFPASHSWRVEGLDLNPYVLIHSLHKYSSSTISVPSIVLGSGVTEVDSKQWTKYTSQSYDILDKCLGKS